MLVAHVPSGHPYVGSVAPDAATLGTGWSSDATDRSVDVVHVHFGFEQVTVAALGAWIDRTHAAGTAIVHTVHDIDNPHLVDQSDHHRRTGLLVDRADAVTTLTRSAADAIERRWGRRPDVIPHPNIASDATIAAERRRSRTRRGAVLWLGTLRPNVDLEAVRAFVRDPPCGAVIVVRDEAWHRCAPLLRRAIDRAERAGRIALLVQPRPSDQQLATMISAAGALVLPYAWGTHSGLVELATDLGVATVVPAVGCHRDQGAVTCASDELAATVEAVVRDPPLVARTTSRDAIRRAHRELYARSAIEGRRAS